MPTLAAFSCTPVSTTPHADVYPYQPPPAITSGSMSSSQRPVNATTVRIAITVPAPTQSNPSVRPS